ncbi:recombinase family protein [Enterococcus casseliflavus]|nr:recombinase family protein [Enterococcus casseliflavus]
MEAELISERVCAVLDAAKENGKSLGRPPLNKNYELVIDLYQNIDTSIAQIAKKAAVSRNTVYRYLKKENLK